MANALNEISPAAAGQGSPARREARYGPFARWLLHRLFDPVPFPADGLPVLQEAAGKGTPVYVLRSSSLLLLLYLNCTPWKHGRPLATAATALGNRHVGP